MGVYSVGGLQCWGSTREITGDQAQNAFQLTIVACQRFRTKNVEKAFDFSKAFNDSYKIVVAYNQNAFEQIVKVQ